MEYDSPQGWLRLTFREREGSLRAALDASIAGVASRTRSRLLEHLDLGAFGIGRAVGIPSDASRIARDALDRLRWSTGAPRSVPVFVRSPSGLDHVRWDEVARRLIGVPDATALRVIRQAERSMPARMFELPIQVLLLGDVGGHVLDDIRGRSELYVEGADLVQPVWSRDAETALALVRQQRFDLVVGSSTDVDELVSGQHVAIRVGTAEPSWSQGITTRARNVVSIVDDEVGRVTDLIDGIASDRPLDELVEEIVPRGHLVSTPEAVHDLRLSRVISRLQVVARDLPDAQVDFDAVVRFVASPVGERMGMPRAHHVTRLRDTQQRVARSVTLERQQQPASGPRVLNLSILRGDGVVAATPSPYLDGTTSLAAGAGYRLEVEINAPVRSSLVEGAPAPVDRLLPPIPASGLTLEIVVAGDAFALPVRVRRLRLPPFGGSEVKRFSFTAPSTPGEHSLRVTVYHENSVVQTYRLDALVEPVEAVHPGPVVVARLDNTATADWSDLDGRRPRLLSLVLNEQIDGTHRMYVKGAQGHVDWNVRDTDELAGMSAFRSTLNAVVAGTLSSDEALRELVRSGRQIRDWLRALPQKKTSRDLVNSVADAADGVIEIVRADATRALPWAYLYDWKLPPAGAAVCWGGSVERPCGHVRATAKDVYCVRGFWGVRHVLEERVGEQTLRSPVTQGGALAVELAIDADDAVYPYASDIKGELAGVVTVSILKATDSLISSWWGPTRPPIVGVIGHFDPAVRGIGCGTADGPLTAGMLADAADEAEWSDPHSIVLLLGCETGVSSAAVASHALALNGLGASAVVTTDSQVMVKDVRAFAAQLLREMADSNGGTTMGRAMQAARQKLVIGERALVGLAFVAFGSSDLEVAA